MGDGIKAVMTDVVDTGMGTMPKARNNPVVRIYLRLRSMLLTVMACIGVISIVLFIGAAAFGLRPMVVISGSMEPEITVGSLILSIETPATSLKLGDVITVSRSGSQRLVTHRIIEAGDCAGERCSFILKGDANIARDPHQVLIESAPRMWIALSGIGYAIVWMRTLPGLITLAVVIVALIMLLIIVPKDTKKPINS
ncbi:signal peptidase I [Bifidobacterium sp.]|jgi:signal peptidase|uniref:signal peptidase I n=1 Tax=Bifidobacterium sp. TaxID=41200 RepID=UPI0025BD7E0B|nr:signal peptidase I [Bifidobacterium sp.]MCI1635383.1 signal peptidase I [Bifidobacterium sp.]